jgi:hypothetical protein
MPGGGESGTGGTGGTGGASTDDSLFRFLQELHALGFQIRRAWETPNAPQGEQELRQTFAALELIQGFMDRPREPYGASAAEGGDMSNGDDLTNARIAAAEARTDAKIARTEGKLDLILSKLDDMREDNRGLRTNIYAVGIGLALLIIACAAAAPVLMDFGFKLRETITKEVREQLPPPAKRD